MCWIYLLFHIKHITTRHIDHIAYYDEALPYHITSFHARFTDPHNVIEPHHTPHCTSLNCTAPRTTTHRHTSFYSISFILYTIPYQITPHHTTPHHTTPHHTTLSQSTPHHILMVYCLHITLVCLLHQSLAIPGEHYYLTTVPRLCAFRFIKGTKEWWHASQ